MRPLSAPAVRELFKQHSGAAWMELLTVEAPDGHIERLCNNTVSITSRGNTFLGFPFSLALPADLAEQEAMVEGNFSNIDERFVEMVRTFESDIKVKLEVISHLQPDVLEVGPYDLVIDSGSYGITDMSVMLTSDDGLNEQYPGDTKTPQNFPQLFAR